MVCLILGKHETRSDPRPRVHREISGTAEVPAPIEKVKRLRTHMPEFRLHYPAARYRQLIARAKGLPALSTGVIHPCDRESVDRALALLVCAKAGS